MNYIVYQAYGSIDILNEVIYSIASVFKQSESISFQIIIYTDNKEYLTTYLPSNIVFECITTQTISSWRGNIDFVHRVKIMMLKDICKKYKGNILYLDTDTIFISPPDPVFQAIDKGQLVMHLNEGLISNTKNPLFRKIFRQIKSKTYLIEGKEIKISSNQEMWNAGVIGFPSQKAHFLDAVLELTDCLYRQYPKHVMEQLAFSYVFITQREIVPSDKFIFHYWNFKEFRSVLAQYVSVEDTFEKILANYNLILPYQLNKPKVKFEKKPKIIRQILKHVLKKTWQPINYLQLKGNL